MTEEIINYLAHTYFRIRRNENFRDYKYHLIKEVKSYVIDNVDAIFIPTRNPMKLYQNFTQYLSLTQNRIFLIPPVGKYSNVNRNSIYLNIPANFIDSFLSFSHHNYMPKEYLYPIWQLPLKRNYAIYYSLKKKYRNVLLLDDDIAINMNKIKSALPELDTYDAISFPSTNFPDKSSIGHIARSLGVDNQVFLSGACLLLRPFRKMPFFPSMYNEDWIFFLSSSLKIACGGCTRQKKYDPLLKKRIIFQEFGDFFAEAYLKTKKHDDLTDLKKITYWKYQKNLRMRYLEDLMCLSKKESNEKYIELLELAILVLKTIEPLRCVNVVNSLEKDLYLWHQLISKLPIERINR